MDVLINATTLVKGGGIQVAAAFIAETCRDDADISWRYAITQQIADDLARQGIDLPGAEVFPSSPAHDKQLRQRLYDIEANTKPDVIFSVFGPTYMKFSTPHLCGVAVGWTTHSTWLAYATLPGWMARAKSVLTMVYKLYWLRFADRWVVEADNARRGLARRAGVAAEKIDVVPNSCAPAFIDAQMPAAMAPAAGETVRLVYVSAYYPHKNLECIPDVAAALAQMSPDRNYEFVITLPDDEPGLQKIMNRARLLGVERMLRNVGRVTHDQILELYSDSHICFMPSLLETFSATYPEAMALGRPIVACDLDFARAACADAAVYFSPNNAAAAARAITALVEDPERWLACIANGRARLSELPDTRRKYELYVEAIKKTFAQAATPTLVANG